MELEYDFRLLGPLEVMARDTVVRIGGERQRVVLAMLLIEAGRVIPVDRLIDAVWDDAPPATARSQIQIAVSELRRRLLGPGSTELISTQPAGYVIRIPDEAIDVVRFRRRVTSARAAARRSDLTAAAAALRSALELWRGDAMAGMRSRLVQRAAFRLDEERLAVAEEWLGLELELGHHCEVMGELRELLAAHPLREKLYGYLMLALYRDGRQAEALEVYRGAYRTLAEEHGIDPGDELRRLERAVLDNDPTLLPSPRRLDLIVPGQLPTSAPDFVGRDETVAKVRAHLHRPAGGDPPRAVEVVVVSGPSGVGKTALALHTAHGVRDSFPDGQLFEHLRGSDVRPTPPELVLDQFLRALGVPPAALPADLDGLAKLFRSRIANRRILVVLDDAAGASQVEPLIPGDPGCALLVTSRNRLPGLHGAHRFDLDVFSPIDSMELLSRVIGEQRVHTEPEAASRLADACGHLPLALRIAAAKLALREHWRIEQLASRLDNERQRLDELTLGGSDVRASISTSFQALAPRARRLLLLLAMLGATDFAGWVAGPLLQSIESTDAVDVMEELVDARLVEVQAADGYRTRYRLHDLIRIFAWEVLATEIPAPERTAAQHRMLRCWLNLACQAHRREYGGDFTVLHSTVPHWHLPQHVVDELVADPIAWFESEHSNLVSAVGLAAKLNHHDLAWDLALTLVTFFEAQAYREAWRETHEIALAAVRRSGNQRGEAAVRYSRGALALVEQRLPEAQKDLDAARAWFDRAGEVHGRGLALRDLSIIDRVQGRYGAAAFTCSAALADLRSAGDRVGEAHALSNLGQIDLERGRFDEAEDRLREALAICVAVGARRVEGQVQHRLGQLYFARGKLAEAEAAFNALARVVNGTGDPVGKAYALLGAGAVDLARGDHTRADESLRAALEATALTGDRLSRGRVLLALAELAHARGDGTTSHARLAEAMALFSDIGAVTWQARAAELRDRLTAN